MTIVQPDAYVAAPFYDSELTPQEAQAEFTMYNDLRDRLVSTQATHAEQVASLRVGKGAAIGFKGSAPADAIETLSGSNSR
ncbi:hypothetical protein JT358_09990 [Micrococcales bacterium 31B]|nr:hypothetical protein [Micrococcales bacterium 31B]